MKDGTKIKVGTKAKNGSEQKEFLFYERRHESNKQVLILNRKF